MLMGLGAVLLFHPREIMSGWVFKAKLSQVRAGGVSALWFVGLYGFK